MKLHLILEVIQAFCWISFVVEYFNIIIMPFSAVPSAGKVELKFTYRWKRIEMFRKPRTYIEERPENLFLKIYHTYIRTFCEKN